MNEQSPIEKLFKTTEPPTGEVIIVQRHDGQKGQVTIRDETAYDWRYGETDKKFCDVVDIQRWRGCTGFDY